jgi:hypothetical protein
MLVPAKLATAGYAATARSALAGDHTLHRVADLSGDPRASFEATVYPMVLVATRGTPAAGHQVRFARGDRSNETQRPQASLSGAPWVLDAGTSADALDAVRGERPRIGDRFRVSLGVKTGCNAVFVDPEAPIEPELLRWALRGRDVRAFRAMPRHRLLWTTTPRAAAQGAPTARLGVARTAPSAPARAEGLGGWRRMGAVPDRRGNSCEPRGLGRPGASAGGGRALWPGGQRPHSAQQLLRASGWHRRGGPLPRRLAQLDLDASAGGGHRRSSGRRVPAVQGERDRGVALRRA